MSIVNFESSKTITGVLSSGERGKKFKLITTRLDKRELDAIRGALDQQIAGSEIHTAGWMPGSDWRGTPYQALYEKGAKKDPTLAALMFGLLVWEAFERHDEEWLTGRFEKNGVEIGSRTYWRKK